jgi:phage terminase small subunit
MPKLNRKNAEGLNDREAIFVAEYPIDCNGTRAARAAGYAHPGVTASQLLKRPRIRAALDKSMSERAEKAGITQERVLRELELLAFSDERHYRRGSDGHLVLAPDAPEGATRALSSVRFKRTTRGKKVEHDLEFRLWDKPSMLKLAGRHVGLFPDRVEIEPGDRLREALALALRGPNGNGGKP